MTTQIVFGCTHCDQTETLTLDEFRLTGYPLCSRHQLRMEVHLPNDEISQALDEAMRAVARLTVVAIRGIDKANSVKPVIPGQK